MKNVIRCSWAIVSVTVGLLLGVLVGGADAQIAPDKEPPAGTKSLFTPTPRKADNALLNAAKAEQAATLKTLERLVKIETGTGDKIGMPQMSKFLADELKALGATVTLQKATNGVVGENVVGKIQGKGGKNVLLMAHMDTVYVRGTLAKTPWRIEGNRAYGPGVGDAKSGIAVILHSLRLLKKRGFQNFGVITVLFNTDEERGSRGSRDLIVALANKNDVILSYEPTLADPEVIPLATSGIGEVKVTIKGLAAHAGAQPENGVNALVEASDLVRRTLNLDKGQGALRFNWTILKAGAVENIVPDKAFLQADVRYPTKASFEEMEKTLREGIAKKRLPKAQISLEVNPRRPPFNADAASKRLIQKAADIYGSIGGKFVVVPVMGGGTDAGFASQSGKPLIETLGLPGFGYHANVGEWVVIDAIPRRLYLSAQMIMDVAQKGNGATAMENANKDANGENQNKEQAGIKGAYFQPTELMGVPTPDYPGTRKLYVHLTEDGKAQGFSGVNRFTGTYESGLDNALKFSRMASTKMAGPPATMQLEDSFLKVLTETTRYRRDGDNVEFLAGDKIIARLKTMPAP